jgi:hypothetical protein
MSDCKPLRQLRQRQHDAALWSLGAPRPSLRAIVAVAFVCLVASCGPRDAAYDTSNFSIHGQFAPKDVAVPTTFNDAASQFNGLYSDGPGAWTCCWIAPRATLLVRKHGPAKTLVAGFRVPNLSRFDDGQTVTIAFAGTTFKPTRARFENGEQYMVKVPVPQRLVNQTGLVPVSVNCAVDYVPSRDTRPAPSVLTMLHLRAATANTDDRELCVVLLYMYFQ